MSTSELVMYMYVRTFIKPGTRLAPGEFQVFFFPEIARNSPACGLAQIRGNEDVISTLKAVAEGSLDILESQNHSELEAVQRCVPVVVYLRHSS